MEISLSLTWCWKTYCDTDCTLLFQRGGKGKVQLSLCYLRYCMEYYLVYSFISFVSRRCLSKPIPVGFLSTLGLYLCAVAVLWGPMLVTLVLTKQGLFFSGDDMILIFCCDIIMFICFVMWTTNMLIPYISLPKRFFPFFSINFVL